MQINVYNCTRGVNDKKYSIYTTRNYNQIIHVETTIKVYLNGIKFHSERIMVHVVVMNDLSAMIVLCFLKTNIHLVFITSGNSLLFLRHSGNVRA